VQEKIARELVSIAAAYVMLHFSHPGRCCTRKLSQVQDNDKERDRVRSRPRYNAIMHLAERGARVFARDTRSHTEGSDQRRGRNAAC
jgi:hypothetical protein